MPITQPITCNVTGSITISITGTIQVVPAAPATPTTWDPDNKHTSIALSGGDLTATSSVAGYKSVRSTTLRDSGACMFEVTGSFGAGEVDQVVMGLALPSMDMATAGAEPHVYGGYDVSWEGVANGPGGGLSVSGLAPVSGDPLYIKIDFEAGEGWFDDAITGGTYSVDAEAGASPHFIFTPGTAFYASATLYTSGANNGEAVADFTVSSGRFGTWDA